MKVQIIRYTYIDNSNNGIVAVFESNEQANLVYDLLEKYGDTAKAFTVDTFEVIPE